MAEDFSKLTIGMPDFGDRKTFLTRLGTIVADGIVAMIEREEQPDGSPQKQNSPKYLKVKIRKKGYTTPLWGIEGGAMSIKYHKSHHTSTGGKFKGIVSPYLARRDTFLKTFYPPDTLVVHLNAKRAEIGKKLTKRGYWFMGITKEAKYNIDDATWKYLHNHLEKMKRGDWS